MSLQGSMYFGQPLISCSRFGERHRGRLLHEAVKNGSGSHSDNEGAQASDGKGTHLLSPNPLKFVAQFETARFRSIEKHHVQAEREKASASRSTKVRPSNPTAE